MIFQQENKKYGFLVADCDGEIAGILGTIPSTKYDEVSLLSISFSFF